MEKAAKRPRISERQNFSGNHRDLACPYGNFRPHTYPHFGDFFVGRAAKVLRDPTRDPLRSDFCERMHTPARLKFSKNSPHSNRKFAGPRVAPVACWPVRRTRKRPRVHSIHSSGTPHFFSLRGWHPRATFRQYHPARFEEVKGIETQGRKGAETQRALPHSIRLSASLRLCVFKSQNPAIMHVPGEVAL